QQISRFTGTTQISSDFLFITSLFLLLPNARLYFTSTLRISMKASVPREDVVNLLRNLRPEMLEDTLEVHRMNYPTDPFIPWSIFSFCTLDGIRLTIEVSNRGFTVGQVGLFTKVRNQTRYHYLTVVKEMVGRSYPTVESILMLASPFYQAKHSTTPRKNSRELLRKASKPWLHTVR
ncbi:hypothetical protein K493DRAFT_92955, partial [Basidiobolus meristosporus CBS 931.73]